MRILIIRHAEPDYATDGLTEKGRREAALLSRRLVNTPMHHIYLSPLGRAIETASYTLGPLGREGQVLPWLAEFRGHVWDEERRRFRVPWDRKPAKWLGRPLLMDLERWTEDPLFEGTNVPAIWQETLSGLDEVLDRHGYRREGGIWRVHHPNQETVVFFCHFGIGAAIASILTRIPPFALWQGTCMLPSSVTTLVTQERDEGIADWRCVSLGDLSHLYIAGESPSLYALFPEVYNGADTTTPDEWPQGPARSAKPLW